MEDKYFKFKNIHKKSFDKNNSEVLLLKIYHVFDIHFSDFLKSFAGCYCKYLI